MSTFTDWNGPSANNVRAKDLVELAAAYTEVRSEYERLRTLLAQKVDAISGKGLSANDFTDALKSKLETSGKVAVGNSNFVTGETVASALDKYVQKDGTKGLSENDFSSTYKSKIDSLGKAATHDIATALDDPNANLVTLSLLNSALSGKVSVATDKDLSTNDFTDEYKKKLDDLINIQTQRFNFKEFNAQVGGSDSVGVYYLLGILDDRAGTAYIRFTDTKSFSAVVNFAVTSELSADGKTVTDYKNGQLSVVTDVEKAGLHNVHFKIVKGTAKGAQHVYLAIQADEWLSKFSSTDGYGLFVTIPFDASGINFIPAGSEDYVQPAGATTVLHDMDYFATADRLDEVEEKLGKLTSLDATGAIYAWPKYDSNGIATNVPDGFHACDGTAITDDKLKNIIGDNYPLIDYHIIQLRPLVEL